MGPLTWPTTGRVCVDSQILIYSIERIEPYYPAIEALWEWGRSGRCSVVASELALLEVLVGPLKAGDARLAEAYEALFDSPDLTIFPVSTTVLRTAASLRATVPSLRTPDAVHASTAMTHGCSAFLTNDWAFRRVPGLRVLLPVEIGPWPPPNGPGPSPPP